EPDPVLARERTARVDRDLQDLRARLHNALDRFHRAVEEQDRMEVPVADVEHVRNHIAITVGDRVHLREDLGELRTRNDGIVEIVVWTDARERRIAELARLPQQLAFARRRGGSHAECSTRLAYRDDG